MLLLRIGSNLERGLFIRWELPIPFSLYPFWLNDIEVFQFGPKMGLITYRYSFFMEIAQITNWPQAYIGYGNFQEHHLWKHWERYTSTTALGSIKSVFVWGRCLVGVGSQLSESPRHLLAGTQECPAALWKQPVDLTLPVLKKETEIGQTGLNFLPLPFFFSDCNCSGIFPVSTLWPTS